tara:strand:+ start:828 stop:1007 length:180 start_codon:yes stop_codon:yes gene_type:complete
MVGNIYWNDGKVRACLARNQKIVCGAWGHTYWIANNQKILVNKTSEKGYEVKHYVSKQR